MRRLTIDELLGVLGGLLLAGAQFAPRYHSPGDPPGEIELAWGRYVALAGSALMLVGSARRTGETEHRRRPPGAI